MYLMVVKWQTFLMKHSVMLTVMNKTYMSVFVLAVTTIIGFTLDYIHRELVDILDEALYSETFVGNMNFIDTNVILFPKAPL